MDINSRNIENIRSQIIEKKGYKPYFADINTGSSILTDYDHFPYTRWWRGIPQSDQPVVAEREAGWRPLNNECYYPQKDNKKERLNNLYCFEAACSTVYPCHPEYLAKHSDKELLNIMLNNNCVVSYR
jgi:hypothetical protein